MLIFVSAISPLGANVWNSTPRNVFKRKVEELKDLKVPDWGARIDPFVLVKVGRTTMRSQTYKRSQDVKMNDKFEFPLPVDHETRGWELWIRVGDAQTQTNLGQISLDLNDIFSDDNTGVPVESDSEDAKKKANAAPAAKPVTRAPLQLKYESITMALEPVKFGEDVSGTIKFSLSCTVPLPKAALIRESRAGLIECELSPAIKKMLLDPKQEAYLSKTDSLVAELEKAIPVLTSSVGGSLLERISMVGGPEMYGPEELDLGSTAHAYIYTPNTVNAFPGGSAGGFVASAPKVKSFLKGFGSGSSPSIKRGSGSTAGIEGPINELPPEVLIRIFSQLPPWSAMNVRRVSKQFEVLSAPALPALWALVHAFQRLQNTRQPDRTPLIQQFCTQALPFMRECIRIVQFLTSLAFLGMPVFVSAPGSAAASIMASTSSAVSSSSPSISAATSSSPGSSASLFGIPSSPSAASSSSPASSGHSSASQALIDSPSVSNMPVPLGCYGAMSNVTRALFRLEAWRKAVSQFLSKQTNPNIWNQAVTAVQAHWKSIPADASDAISMEDPQFWTFCQQLFSNAGDTDFKKSCSNLIGPMDSPHVIDFVDRLRSQLERKVPCSLQEASKLCEVFIMLNLLLKTAGVDRSKTIKNSKYFAFLKDYEHVIPPDCTRFLIASGILKDRTYTKFL